MGAHFFLCVSESSGVDKLRAKQEKGKDHARHGQNHDSERDLSGNQLFSPDP